MIPCRYKLQTNGKKNNKGGATHGSFLAFLLYWEWRVARQWHLFVDRCLHEKSHAASVTAVKAFFITLSLSAGSAAMTWSAAFSYEPFKLTTFSLPPVFSARATAAKI
jgi:hypothetical protein